MSLTVHASRRDFYVVLPSDASMDVYPDNKVNNFSVKLPYPLHFDRQRWEVGVSELHFPMSWHNVRHPFNLLSLIIDARREVKIYEPGEYPKRSSKNAAIGSEPIDAIEGIIIPEGLYSSPELIRTLNTLVRDTIESKLKEMEYSQRQSDGRHITKTYAFPIHKFKFTMEDAHVQLKMPEPSPLSSLHAEKTFSMEVVLPMPILNMLGFVQVESRADRFITHKQGTIAVGSLGNDHTSIHKGVARADRLAGFDTIYVYSSLVEDQHVGNTMAPLLMHVPVSRKMMKDSVVVKTPQHIKYMGLRHGTADTIQVYIMDDAGHPVPFQRGKAIVTLHFRQSR